MYQTLQEERRRPLRLYPSVQGEQTLLPPPPTDISSLLVSFPAIGDNEYSHYRFYQVNKGELPIPQTDYVWVLSDDVGQDILQNQFDIRAFAGTGRKNIGSAREESDLFRPGFDVNVIQLSDDQLHLFVWEFENPIHEYVLSTPHVFPSNGATADFTFSPSEGNGRDMKFIDNGNKMAVVGVGSIIEVYDLPSRNSFSEPPIFKQSFIPFQEGGAVSCDFTRDGLKLYVINTLDDIIHQWNLTEPFVLPTFGTSSDRTFSFNPTINSSNGNMRMSTDGSKFYLMSVDPSQINQYNTEEAYQIPTDNKPPDSLFDKGSLSSNSRAISLSVDGSLMWFSSRTDNDMHELFISGVPLEYYIEDTSPVSGDFLVDVKVPVLQDLSFIQLAFGNPAATDNSSSTLQGEVLSTHKTPVLTKDEVNFLVDDQGRRIQI